MNVVDLKSPDLWYPFHVMVQAAAERVGGSLRVLPLEAVGRHSRRVISTGPALLWFSRAPDMKQAVPVPLVEGLNEVRFAAAGQWFIDVRKADDVQVYVQVAEREQLRLASTTESWAGLPNMRPRDPHVEALQMQIALSEQRRNDDMKALLQQMQDMQLAAAASVDPHLLEEGGSDEPPVEPQGGEVDV